MVAAGMKFVITKSSMDRAKASSAPARTPGQISGSVTFRNVMNGTGAEVRGRLLQRAVEPRQAGPDRDGRRRRC